MNWYNNYKISQQDIVQQYSELSNTPGDIQITGSGVGETLNIRGQSINARDILNQIINRIRPVLLQNGVREIDTSPISNAQAQGLAVSHEVGIIHLDIRKIFNQHRQVLPPTTQFDGTQMDPDIVNELANQILNSIGQELTETISHEGFHVTQFQEALQQGKPFTSVQESPAEQYGRSMRSQVFNL